MNKLLWCHGIVKDLIHTQHYHTVSCFIRSFIDNFFFFIFTSVTYFYRFYDITASSIFLEGSFFLISEGPAFLFCWRYQSIKNIKTSFGSCRSDYCVWIMLVIVCLDTKDSWIEIWYFSTFTRECFVIVTGLCKLYNFN